MGTIPHKTLRLSVTIPTWSRADTLKLSLTKILECRPAPGEILVHVDAGDEGTARMLEAEFPQVKVLRAAQRLGPGGGRNALAQAASGEWLASFDDDSYPLDADYFARAQALAGEHPKAAVLAAAVVWRGQAPASPEGRAQPARVFENCGCLIRRSAFLSTQGYLPLAQAYGMEEADLALQLLDQGWSILKAPALRVFHDAETQRHGNPETNAAHIRNTALLAFLRYPLKHWTLGLLQTLNRIRYAIQQGRLKGIGAGLLQIPVICWHFRKARRPVSSDTLRRSRRLT